MWIRLPHWLNEPLLPVWVVSLIGVLGLGVASIMLCGGLLLCCQSTLMEGLEKTVCTSSNPKHLYDDMSKGRLFREATLVQEPRKGGFGKGRFCRVQCRTQGDKKYPSMLGPAVHLALRAPHPREARIFAQTLPLQKNSLFFEAILVIQLQWIYVVLAIAVGPCFEPAT